MEKLDLPSVLSRCGQTVVPADRVQLGAEAARIPIPGQGSTEPQIELVEDGGVIRAIDVTCSCGGKIRIVCDYD